MFVEMKVHAIAVDPFSNVPIVLLKDIDETNTLPIWIGILEANAIATHLENQSFSRPMTHDLIREILSSANVEVKRIEVTDLKGSVFYATIHMRGDGGDFEIDARPSDAIALALRTSSPIMVDESVIRKSQSLKSVTEIETAKLDSDDLLELLEGLSIEEFGKYRM